MFPNPVIKSAERRFSYLAKWRECCIIKRGYLKTEINIPERFYAYYRVLSVFFK